MENASKALMMAAGVLIGLLILSLAVYLFANFGSASAEAHKRNAENQINQFNAQFTIYEGRNDVTIHDIVTVANLAKSSNASYDLTEQTDTNYYISVGIYPRYGYEKMSTTQLEALIQADIQKIDENPERQLPTYTCTVNINPNTQRVSTVTFTNNN